MRISDSTSLYPNSGAEALGSGSVARSRNSAGQGTEGTPAAAGDTPALGSSAAALAADAATQPDVRAATVEALRQQVQSGTYTTNSQAIAGAMLADPQTGLADE